LGALHGRLWTGATADPNPRNLPQEPKMKNHAASARTVMFACLCCILFVPARAAVQSLPPPKEYADLKAAEAISDPAARIAELKRIRATNTDARVMQMVNEALLSAVSQKSASFNELTAGMAEVIDPEKNAGERMHFSTVACHYLVNHPKVAEFPKGKLVKAVGDYRAKASSLMADPKTLEAVPEVDAKATLAMHRSVLETSMAKAQLLDNDPKAAIRTLEAYGKDGTRSGYFYRLLGEAYSKRKLDKDALEAYFSAVAEGDAESIEPAKGAYAKLRGGGSGFDEALDRRLARLTFHPEKFVEPKDWKGKAVLAELFTGSECPPCVGADFGFDALIEGYPSKYLAVLEYHLPIPRPDPMMNNDAKTRGEFYGITSTPSVAMDGAKLAPGGGSKRDAERLYRQYKTEIDARIAQDPIVAIAADALLEGDKLKVKCQFSKVLEGARFYVALAQEEEMYRGANGIVFHKMVVRKLFPLPAWQQKDMTATFDLADIENRTDEYLTEFENTSDRFKGFKFPARHNKIGRGRLKAVLFAQDANTKQVYNAFVADVATISK